MKNIIKIALFTLLFTFVNVNALSAPSYDSEKDIFYANGTAITVSARNDDVAGAKITWGTSGVQLITPNTVIFGGSKEASVTSSSITINGGEVYDVFGGGQGSTTIAANVDTAEIQMTDGYAISLNGGGYLKSTVKNTTINMTGGMVANVQGGGYASGQTYITSLLDASGTEEHPELSTTIVNKATINITGGRINDKNEGWGILAGGGLGYNYVKETTINLGGTFGDTDDYTYVVVGGLNGRTDIGTLNITGGIIYLVQGVNRGSIGSGTINMTGGTVEEMYVGGETRDSKVTGTITDKMMVATFGGTINSFAPGKSGGTVIPANSSLMNIYLGDANIETPADLNSVFGTSISDKTHLFPYMSKGDSTIFILGESSDEVDTITTSSLEDAKKLGVYYGYQADNYVWEFDSNDLTDTSIEVNPVITITEEAPVDIKTDIEKLIPAGEKVLFANFAHNGVLPGKATIILLLYDSDYEAGDTVYVAHYNETKKVLEKSIKTIAKSTDEEDPSGLVFVEFSITECSSYVISSHSLVANPNTADNILMYVLYVVAGLGLMVGAIYTKKRFS